MKRGEAEGEGLVPGKPDCFLQLLHDLVFANLPDEHLLDIEKTRHGDNSMGVVLRFRRTVKVNFGDEEMQCRQVALKCVLCGKEGRELGPSCYKDCGTVQGSARYGGSSTVELVAIYERIDVKSDTVSDCYNAVLCSVVDPIISQLYTGTRSMQVWTQRH